MAEISQEQIEKAIAQAKKEVADEVWDHKAEDKDLEDVVGGAGVGGGWIIDGGGTIYST